MLFKRFNPLINFARTAWTPSDLTYKQGQWINNIREYFYYVDHNGQLFLDDSRMKNFTSCFKDKHFLRFFFWRLKSTTKDEYTKDFPYMSPCGKECNFLRCDDRPIVFTELDVEEDRFIYNNTSKSYPFEPSKLCMFPNGRLYHPSQFGTYGLVMSKLADELYHDFEFNDRGDPVAFTWKGEKILLTNELLKYAEDDDAIDPRNVTN